MVGVAQLVRAPDCGSGGRRFNSGGWLWESLACAGLFLLTERFGGNSRQPECTASAQLKKFSETSAMRQLSGRVRAVPYLGKSPISSRA